MLFNEDLPTKVKKVPTAFAGSLSKVVISRLNSDVAPLATFNELRQLPLNKTHDVQPVGRSRMKLISSSAFALLTIVTGKLCVNPGSPDDCAGSMVIVKSA